MIIFIDVDDVCADLMRAWLEAYNDQYGDCLTPEDITDWDISKFVKPECGKQIYRYLDSGDLYDVVEPIPNALEGVRLLREMGHHVVFASSGIGQAGRKYDWLVDHGFLVPTWKKKDYVGGYDKGLLRGDLLIDDGLHNVVSFQGLSILMRRPHNTKAEWPVVANSWADIIASLQNGLLADFRHITERTRPEQTKAFREIMDKMYQVHLDKNADYSPANILGTGEIGLMTSTWDKIARLMNLMGFKIEISSMRFESPTAPKNESIEDSIQDLAVYAIIWQLYRKGVWGK